MSGPLRAFVNGAVVRLLRSHAHPLLSRALLLLTFRGRRTGRRYTIPLLYARDGAGLLLVALHPEGQSWWRNARDGVEVEILLAGRRLRARAALEKDVSHARRVYASARPWTTPILRRTSAALFVRLSPLE